jgi:hypothetical protein
VTQTTARRWAWALWGAALALGLLFVVLVVVNAPSPGPLEFAEVIWIIPIYLAVMMALPTVGAIVVARQPSNAIGWLFCGSGIAMASAFSLQLYGDTALHLHPGLAGGRAALAIGIPLFVVGMVMGTFLPMFLFPTGRSMSVGWRWVLRALIVVFAVAVLGSMTAPELGMPYEGIANPLALPVIASTTGPVARSVFDGLAPFVAFTAVVALVVRFRRSRGVERQQMKWFSYAAGFMGGSLAVGFTFSAIGWQLASDVMWVSAMLGLAFLPVAIGIAILRYRLFEIDRILSRTVSYAVLSALLVALYAGAVVLIGRVLAPVTRESELAVAAATLLVAAAFNPLRGRVQMLVDRRFNRHRYDAERTVEAFTLRLRDAVALDELRTELVEAVDGTVQPAAMSMWLRGPA